MHRPLAVVAYNPDWAARFEQEKSRLVAALGMVTAGGVIENIQHVGSTSIPGLAARPSIDIMMSVWPFPPREEAVSALEALGFTRQDSQEENEQWFMKGQDQVHLQVVEAGSDVLTEHLLMREYLRASTKAANLYERAKREIATRYSDDPARYQDAHLNLKTELLNEARTWYRQEVRFTPLLAVLDELRNLTLPFLVSSGWAVDLHLGHVTRVHHDVDIILYRRDQLELQGYMMERGWAFVAPYAGQVEPWPRHMRLALPRHQVHAYNDGRFIDFLLSEVEHDVWRFRRDPAVVRTLDRLTLKTSDGISYLAPEVVLLHKSSYAGGAPRPQDQADFDSLAPHLEPERCAWLRWALEVYQPGHPWLEQLR